MKRTMMHVAVCVLATARLAAAGEGAMRPASAELVESLLERIDALERRVAELERGPKEARPAPAAEAVAMDGDLQTHHTASSEPTQSEPVAPAMKLSGFSDFNFSATDARGVRSGFNEGQFALHLSSVLSPRVTVFGELSFSARADAGTGTPPATGFNPEVERLLVRFDQSDRFKASFGRYHTPINWWNTAFHHGQWLQTTVSRPEMTQFGGRFIPVHFVGGLIEGSLPAGGLDLNYNAGIGNGRGSVISRGGDAGDNNNYRAWLVNLFAKPMWLYGLQAGGSVYRDRITLPAGNFDEWITSGHLVWSKEDPEVIAEAANVHHRAVGGGAGFDSQAYYIQLAYRLPFGQRKYKPYYRFEHIHIPRGDVVFTGVPGLTGSLVGLRYDMTSFAAVKMEYRYQRRPSAPTVNGGFLQTSFTF
jgi:hypothetical protein